MRSWIVIPAVCASLSCADMGSEPKISGFSSAKAVWQASHISDYSMEQRLICFCAFGGEKFKVVVRNRAVVDVIDLDHNTHVPEQLRSSFKSIDELFTFLESLQGRDVAELRFEFDKAYGYPTKIYVDYDRNVADEEMGYESKDLARE